MSRHTLPTIVAAVAAFFLALPAIAQTNESNAMPTPSKSGYAPVNGVEYLLRRLSVTANPSSCCTAVSAPSRCSARSSTCLGRRPPGHRRRPAGPRPHAAVRSADDVRQHGDDIAELIKYLGYEKADVMGVLRPGGGIALRTGIEHPAAGRQTRPRLDALRVLRMARLQPQGMKQIAAAPEQIAEALKQTPMYETYAAIAPDPGNWSKLVRQTGEMVAQDYDWSAEVDGIAGSHHARRRRLGRVRTSHTVQFFELLGGGRHDATVGRLGHERQPARDPTGRHPLHDLHRSQARGNGDRIS